MVRAVIKGGYRGTQREWLMQRCRKDFTVRGLMADLAERCLKVDYCTSGVHG
jgi:putative transposase